MPKPDPKIVHDFAIAITQGLAANPKITTPQSLNNLQETSAQEAYAVAIYKLAEIMSTEADNH